MVDSSRVFRSKQVKTINGSLSISSIVFLLVHDELELQPRAKSLIPT